MQFAYSKNFKKEYKKLPRSVKEKFSSQLRFFEKNPRSKILRIHKLQGKFEGFYSINITGDIRAIYEIVDDNIYYFVAIGSHSELYS